jgi:hypothetical protein
MAWWNFKKEPPVLEEVYSSDNEELLALLRDEKKRRAEDAERQIELELAAAEARKEFEAAKERRQEERETRLKKQARTNLEKMERYLVQMDLTESISHRANLMAIVETHRERALNCGVVVEPNLKSVQHALVS